MERMNVVLMGVGGQGSLLASRILGNIAAQLGLDAKVSEVHGMSQRGGSVSTYVRMGKKVYAPLVEQGGADYVIAFEELEALRALPYLKKGGTMVVSTQQIMPMPVVTGMAEYPADIVGQLKSKVNTVAVDALALARQAGSPRTANVVLLGALSRMVGIDREIWINALSASVPERFTQANMAAFELGEKVV